MVTERSRICLSMHHMEMETGAERQCATVQMHSSHPRVSTGVSRIHKTPQTKQVIRYRQYDASQRFQHPKTFTLGTYTEECKDGPWTDGH